MTRGSSRTDTYLDGFGRSSRSINSRGVITETSYDACGRTRYVSLPYCAAGSGCPSDGASNVGTTYGYDGLDRLTRRVNPDTSAVTYAYSNGIDVTITNERNKATFQDWNAFGSPDDARLASVRDADARTWSYSYNALGSLTRVTPPVGAARTWTYYGDSDGHGTPGLLKTETHPESGTVTYTYDGTGLMKTRKDALDATFVYSYDADDRLTLIDRPGDAYDTHFSWDASNNRTLLTNGYVRSVFAYDVANRLTSRMDTVGTHTFTTAYLPDANDNIQQIDYPTGLQVKYQFDSENRITDIGKPGTGGAGAWARTFSYHPSGAPASFTTGNGEIHRQTFTSRYWPHAVNSGDVNQTYGYDNVGNITSITDARGTSYNQTYTYDAIDRVRTANGKWGAGTFGYDAAGNRLTKTVAGAGTTYEMNASTGRLDAARGAEPGSYAYDANGNNTGVDGAPFTYTPTNMLETVGVVTYRYDGDDLRTVRSNTTGRSRYFIHGPGGAILSEMLQCGASTPIVPIRDYVYLGSRLLAAVVQTNSVSIAPTAGIGEAAGSLSVTVSLDETPGQAVSVAYRTVDGTAGAGDYSGVTEWTTLEFGADEQAKTITIPITNDAVVEANETFTIQLSSPSCGLQLGNAGQTVTIRDDDPIFAFVAPFPGTVSEAVGSIRATVRVRTFGGEPLSQVASVQFTTADGTAGANATSTPLWIRDYAAVPSTPQVLVTFPEGTASGSTALAPAVTITNDGLDEYDEAFSLNLNLLPGNQWSIETASAPVTISDDDPPPSVGIADAELEEAEAPLEFTVTLSRDGTRIESGKTISVTYATVHSEPVEGIASDLEDYYVTSGTLTFSPGESQKPIGVPLKEDEFDEWDETFTVALGTATNATIPVPPSPGKEATGRILDDDPLTPFCIPDQAFGEGDEGTTDARVWTALRRQSGKTVTATYATGPDDSPASTPATAGFDYIATAGTVTFQPGETTKTVTVPIVGDGQAEPAETFLLNATGAVNAVENPGDCGDHDWHGVVGIMNDDPSIAGVELTTGVPYVRQPDGSRHWYRIGQKSRSSYEVVVDATTANGPASALEMRYHDGVGVRRVGGSVSPGIGFSRSLRWVNSSSSAVSGELLLVQAAPCPEGESCPVVDAYRIQLRETTYSIPRFNAAAGQTTVVMVQNTGGDIVIGRIYFWDGTGTLLAQKDFGLLARQVLVLNAATVDGVAGQSGSMTVMHDGHYGQLSGKAVSMETATGFSFDTPMIPVR